MSSIRSDDLLPKRLFESESNMIINLREPPADKKKTGHLGIQMETMTFEKKPKSFFEKGGVGVTCQDREILVNWLILC